MFRKDIENTLVDSAFQVNDGLNECAACASTVVYDKSYGLVFLVYMSGTRTSYGEASGRIALSVFSPSQPWNARHVRIDEGIGGARGVLCTCAWLLSPGKIRILFTTVRGTQGAYYRDYDFDADTVSGRTEVFLSLDGKAVPCTNENYRALIGTRGFTDVTDNACLINKSFVWNGDVFTALTVDGKYYPVLCRIRENMLEPFAFCPVQGTYEFRYYIDETGIHAVYRTPVDDQGLRKSGYLFSGDLGKTWENTVFEDGIQSRPDILPYRGKPLIIYNYKNDRSVENFPPMHNCRNAIRMLYGGKPVFDCFQKYGIVEHTTVDIFGDLYMAFSTCEQALSVSNGKAWIEQGRPVEQGKEEIKWVKLGSLPECP